MQPAKRLWKLWLDYKENPTDKEIVNASGIQTLVLFRPELNEKRESDVAKIINMAFAALWALEQSTNALVNERVGMVVMNGMLSAYGLGIRRGGGKYDPITFETQPHKKRLVESATK